jgi:putative addiction module killer protein
MIEIRKTDVFENKARIDRLQLGNPGDVKPVGAGVSEMRIDHGPGYRVYFTERQGRFIILLAGGDKRSQRRIFEKPLSWQRVFED